MVLWRLQGGAGVLVCSLEKWRCGYRLLVEGAPDRPDLAVDENHISVDAARGRAEAIRATLLGGGWALTG